MKMDNLVEFVVFKYQGCNLVSGQHIKSFPSKLEEVP